MTTYFISRHVGAQEWAQRQGFNATVVAHFDPSVVQTGDVVLGTLPINLAADVIANGGTYHHLSLNIPAELRGLELSADIMEELGARLQQFHVVTVD